MITDLICPECNRGFTPARVNQKYCSVKCRKKSSGHTARAKMRQFQEFAAVDGEGQPVECLICNCERFQPKELDFSETSTIPPEAFLCAECEHHELDHMHRYVLLGVGNENWHHQIENPLGLSPSEIFVFLYHMKIQHPRAIFVGYYLGYDFTQWTRFFPEERARRLLTKAGINARRRVTYQDGRALSKTRPVDVHIGGGRKIEIDMLGKKRMEFRPYVPPERAINGRASLVPDKPMLVQICDAGSFFQETFASAINPKNWKGDSQPCSEEEYGQITAGKSRRAIAVLDDEMREYNKRENIIMCKLMHALDAALRDIGVELKPNQWFSPGQIASALLRRYGAPERQDIEKTWPGDILGYLVKGFSAGWFEDFAHGIIPGRSYLYDINSAYPYQITKLPCIGRYMYRSKDEARPWSHEDINSRFCDSCKCGSWKPSCKCGHIHEANRQRCQECRCTELTLNRSCLCGHDEAKHTHKIWEPHGRWEYVQIPNPRPGHKRELPPLPAGHYRYVNARYKGSDKYIGVMPHRLYASSLMMRPHETISWQWQTEIEAAQRAGVLDSFTPTEYIEFIPECDCEPPLRDFAELYAARKRVGKKTIRGKAYKLGYNSPYGKTAQSVGDPQFSNPFWASLITSGCRTQILDAIATHPEGTKAVLKIATDSVLFTSLHPGLALSDELGDWSQEDDQDDVVLFGPGKSWDMNALEAIRQGIAPVFKSRGFSARDVASSLQGITDDFAKWEPGTKPVFPVLYYPASFPLVTSLQALQRNQWHLAGTTVPTAFNELKQDSATSFKNKRRKLHFDPETGFWRSEPYDRPWRVPPRLVNLSYETYYGPELMSQPYDKRFGIANAEDEQWAEDQGGCGPDGPFSLLMNEAMGN